LICDASSAGGDAAAILFTPLPLMKMGK